MEGAQEKEKPEEGAVWHQEGEMVSMVLARSTMSDVGVHEVGPGYTFRECKLILKLAVAKQSRTSCHKFITTW